MLLPVDDFERSILAAKKSNRAHISVSRSSVSEETKTYGQPGADVARVQPAVLVERLAGLFWFLEIALEDVGAFDADLAVARHGVVLHFGHVDELDGTARDGGADVFGRRVALDGERGGRHALRLAVALDDDAAEGAAHEGQHRAGQRRRADDQQPDASAHALLDLAQHQLVPDRVVADDAAPHFSLLRVDGSVEQETLQRRAVEAALHLVEYPKDESRESALARKRTANG